MPKNRINPLIYLFSILVLMSVASASSADPLRVAVSIPPQKYFVEAIGGAHVAVTVLVPPTAEPENYEPTPKQVLALAHSALFLGIGVPIERAWIPRFQAANPRLVVVDTTRGINKMPMVRHLHSGEHEPAHDPQPTIAAKAALDPHIWLSPVLARIVAINTRDALIAADPAHAADFRQGYARLARTIDQVDEKILATLTEHPLKQTEFIVFHPAFGYFAAAYGLTQVPIEMEGKEPGPKQLAELIEFAKNKRITVIFIEPQFAQKAAQTIAQSIGGAVATIDPLQENWPAGMEAIATALKQALH